jgi:hypothetical protein
VPANSGEGVVNLVVEEPEVNREGGHGDAALGVLGREETGGAGLAGGLASSILEITDRALGAHAANRFGLAETVLAGGADFALLPIGVLANDAAGASQDALGGVSSSRFVGGVAICAGGARGTAIAGLVAAGTTGLTGGASRLGLEGASIAVEALPLAGNWGKAARSAVVADAGVL